MHLKPIAYIKSPYKQKFAIPRQANLVTQAIGELIFTEDYCDPNCLREIEQFSHLWLIFEFHETAQQGWSPLVKPPRLGGKDKVGVFASRSTFRPNALGMSVVENLQWQQKGKQLSLSVRGLDLLDGTPILDIKPYIPYADSIKHAQAGYATEPPVELCEVIYSPQAEEQLIALSPDYPELKDFINGVLSQDPRSAWQKKKDDKHEYGMNLYDLNIVWKKEKSNFLVIRIEPVA